MSYLNSKPETRDWKRAPNFVAKRYKKPVARDVYFADVVLQVRGVYAC